MKKTAILFVLAVAIVALFSSVALAAWGNADYAPNWVDYSGGDPSPHANYTANTTKCFVCHAVHNASGIGEALLERAIADACTYCHVDTAGAGYTQVYGSTDTNFQVDTVYNHSGTLSFASNNQHVVCTDCHAVHGANTLDTGANILKLRTYTAAGQATPTVDADVTEWCSGCHAYFYEDYNQVSHVMTTNVASYGNSAASNTGAKVAWVASQDCVQCHDGGSATVGSADTSGFPHWQPGYPRFLENGTVTAVGGEDRVVNDGVCLACHESGVMGVGQSF